MPKRKKHDRLTNFARGLRRTSTPAERIIWRKLRDHRFSGIQWRRQQPFGEFILDFYCPNLRIAVELDGDTHVGKELHDAKRQAWIESQGVRVLRFNNGWVKDNLAWVLDTIWEACGRPQPPTPVR